MSEHTKGPWRLDHYENILDVNGEKVVATGLALSMAGRDSEVSANARLIAAAPDLLEALQEVLKTIEDSDHWWMDSPSKGGFDAEKISALIAKAKGEA